MFRKPMKNNSWKTYGSKRKTQTLTYIRKKVEQSEMLHTVGGNVKCTVRHMENDLGVSTKAGHRRTR